MWHYCHGIICVPEFLSGSLIIGTIGSFKLLCSFCKNRDVVAICRSASIPSFIVLAFGLGFCTVVGGYFGYLNKVTQIIWHPYRFS